MNGRQAKKLRRYARKEHRRYLAEHSDEIILWAVEQMQAASLAERVGYALSLVGGPALDAVAGLLGQTAAACVVAVRAWWGRLRG
jgi:hypothetical protein